MRFWPSLLILSVLAAAEPDPPVVLLLHSYHQGDWTEAVRAGFTAGLGGRRTDLITDFLDTKKCESPAYLAAVAGAFAFKYPRTRPALVATSDDHALRFALAHRQDLFVGAPVVFCGANEPDLAAVRDAGGCTGVVEHGEWAATIALARRLRPQAARLVVLCDDTRTGRANLAEFERDAAGAAPGLPIEVWRGIALAELAHRLATLSPETPVFFLAYWDDGSGRHITPDDLAPVFAASAAPVFGRSEWMIGRGQTGGKCVTGEGQGGACGRLAARVLAGEDAGAIPVITDSPNAFLFDHRELVRHGIDPALLPPGSDIRFRPEPFLRLDRRLAWVLGIAVALLAGTGLVALLAALRARRAAAALRASEARYRALVDHIELGITLVDRDYRVVMMNPAASRLVARSEGECQGRHCFAVFENRIARCEDCPGRQAMEQVCCVYREREAVAPDGGRVPVGIRAFPLPGPDGRPSGFIEVVEDLRERRRLEADRDRLQDELRHAQRMEAVGRLAGGIAHDFNNVLAGMVGAAEMLAARLPDADGPARGWCELIAASGERAGALTRQLLAISRKGRREVRPVVVDDLVRQAGELLARTLGPAIRLELRLAAPGLTVAGDAGLLEAAILNLGANARDAMPDGGALAITTGRSEIAGPAADALCLPAGAYAAIAVADTGSGIPADLLPRIFEPFFTTKAAGRGTGLGLAAVEGAAREHGGAVQVDSAAGRGSVFTLLLPVAAVAAEPERPSAPAGRGRVLVADDEDTVRQVEAAMLADAGWRVVEAVDGREAVEAFRRGGFDVVVLDLVMPHLGGADAMAEILHLDPRARVVIASGYAPDTDIAQLRAAGAAAVLGKPFRREALLRVLAEAVRRPG